MAQYRTKPVVIEAWRWEGSFLTDAPAYVLGLRLLCHGNVPAYLLIPSLGDEMRASPGDWIIKGARGEIYPCKPDIFAATYDPV